VTARPLLTPDERAARRERRRAQVRCRRAVASALLVLVAALLGGAVAAGGDDGRAVVASPAARAPERTRTKPRIEAPRTPAASTRSRLGSGTAVTLAFGGDVHFEPPIRGYLDADPASVLAPIAPVLRGADLAMVNLETAVTDRGEPAPAKAFRFRAPASAFAALRAGGVDVATVANNHGMDYGVTGLRDTLAAAKAGGVAVVGAGWSDTQAYRPYRATISGQRIAVIGATQVLDDHLIGAWTAGPGKAGLASAKDEERLLEAVRAARATSDTVVVYLHWGRELESCPTEAQRPLARRLVAAGADVVVGAHAHVLLGAGRMNGALVAYGLGNFAFYAFRESTSQTGVLLVTVTGRRVDRYRWAPARITNGRPVPLDGTAGATAARAWNALRRCTGLAP
jgi:poly-gamma-glutamate synthesis protein (capsule biosynthesis protein)